MCQAHSFSTMADPKCAGRIFCVLTEDLEKISEVKGNKSYKTIMITIIDILDKVC